MYTAQSSRDERLNVENKIFQTSQKDKSRLWRIHFCSLRLDTVRIDNNPIGLGCLEVALSAIKSDTIEPVLFQFHDCYSTTYITSLPLSFLSLSFFFILYMYGLFFSSFLFFVRRIQPLLISSHYHLGIAFTLCVWYLFFRYIDFPYRWLFFFLLSLFFFLFSAIDSSWRYFTKIFFFFFSFYL